MIYPWLMQGDCLERLKEIPDGSVDLVVTSPPPTTILGIIKVTHLSLKK